MLDYVREQLAGYVQSQGRPPGSIAFVLLGSMDQCDDCDAAFSWSPGNEQTSRMAVCSTAATLLTKRALGI